MNSGRRSARAACARAVGGEALGLERAQLGMGPRRSGEQHLDRRRRTDAGKRIGQGRQLARRQADQARQLELDHAQRRLPIENLLQRPILEELRLQLLEQ